MNSDYGQKILARVERLRVLRDLGFAGQHHETLFDRFTHIASDVLQTPISLVTMVAANYQFFSSQVGLEEPWASQRSTPISHSFCQHVAISNKPLIVTDAREVELLKHNKAIVELDVIGYLGMPLTLFDGTTLGSFCAIDQQPHEWSQVDVDIMRELGEIITRDIDLRVFVRMEKEDQATLTEFEDKIETLAQQLDTSQSKSDFLNQLKTLRAELGI